MIVLIKCLTGTEAQVKALINELSICVKRIDIITGEYDVIIFLEAETHSKLQQFVLGKLRRVPNIIQSVSLQVLEE